MAINYFVGNLFDSIPEKFEDTPIPDDILILHVVNNEGKWGAGFVLPLAERFPEAKRAYQEWHQKAKDYKEGVGKQLGNPWGLGQIQVVPVQKHVFVVNMMAQYGLRSASNPRPLRYWHLVNCLEKVRDHIYFNHTCVKIVAPAFGSGLAGGNWEFISILLDEIMPYHVDVYVLNEEELARLGVEKTENPL